MGCKAWTCFEALFTEVQETSAAFPLGAEQGALGSAPPSLSESPFRNTWTVPGIRREGDGIPSVKLVLLGFFFLSKMGWGGMNRNPVWPARVPADAR